MMKINHLVSSVGQSSFGLGQVALNLAKEHNALGQMARIWCLSTPSEIQWASRSSGLAEGYIIPFPPIGPKRWAFTPNMELAAARTPARTIDVVHQHGIWTGITRVTNLLRRKHGIRTVIAPHGSLDRWAIKHSCWKKTLALAAYERRNLYGASCLQATSDAEVSDFRDFGLTNPIALICNGASEQWLRAQGDPSRFRSRFGIPQDRRIILFLSRISPKKGLFLLIKAIKGNEAALGQWLLIIAGSNEFGHRAKVEALIESLALNDKVRVLGPLFGQEKRDAFSAADVFTLPSISEGAPVVILDSLAAGVPVITTKASPWKELKTHDCGWWVDINTSAIGEALCAATGLSRPRLQEMGARGKMLVSYKYSWPRIANQTLALYAWLLGQGEKPDFVIID